MLWYSSFYRCFCEGDTKVDAASEGFALSPAILILKHQGLEVLARVNDLVVGNLVGGRKYAPAEEAQIFGHLELGIFEESGGEDDGFGDDALEHDIIATMKYENGLLLVTYLSAAQDFLVQD